MIKELKDLLRKEAEQKGEEFQFEWAKTLSHLGYTFEDAVKKLKEAGIPIILTENEKRETFERVKKAEKDPFYEGPINTKEFESISDIVMVHKTDYPPKGDKIHSRYSGKVLDNCKIKLGGIEYGFTSESGRDTVHLATNHEVTGSIGANWDEMKYAVIIPFEDLKKHSTIQNAVSVDTYTRGPVSLTQNCYILCPKGESQAIQAENPNVTVIEYEGENAKDYANMLIAQLGYKMEVGNNYGFQDMEQDRRFYEIMKKEGLTSITHAYSADKHREVVLGEAYKIIGIIKLIIDEGILDKVDRQQLIEELNAYGFDKIIEKVLIQESRKGKDRQIEEYRQMGYTEDMISTLVRDSGENYDEVFIEELKKMGIDISAEGLGKAVEASRDVEKTAITGYVLDCISSRDKSKRVDSRKIAEASVARKITTSEIKAIDGTIIGKTTEKGNRDVPKGEG